MPINPGLTLIPHAAGQARSPIILAYVSRNQPLPATFNDPLHVNPAWNLNDYWTITTGIPAIHGATLPVAGTMVTLLRDPYGNLTIISWIGQYT